MTFRSMLFNKDDLILFDFGSVGNRPIENSCDKFELLSENVISKTIIFKIGPLYYEGRIYNEKETVFPYECTIDGEGILVPYVKKKITRIIAKPMIQI